MSYTLVDLNNNQLDFKPLQFSPCKEHQSRFKLPHAYQLPSKDTILCCASYSLLAVKARMSRQIDGYPLAESSELLSRMFPIP